MSTRLAISLPLNCLINVLTKPEDMLSDLSFVVSHKMCQDESIGIHELKKGNMMTRDVMAPVSH